MKISNAKKVGALTVMASTLVTTAFAGVNQALQNGLADWVSLVAEILSFACLAVFIVYAGKYITTSKSASSGAAENVKVTEGVKNGIMTALVGIGICQAVIIVAQALFIK